MNTDSEHRALVRRLKKKPEDINPGPPSIDAIHMALGLAGEAGEVVDLIKKSVINGHFMNSIKLREEVGDVLFYLQGISMVGGFTLEEAMVANSSKLNARYSDGYSDAASRERVDVEGNECG